MLLFANIIIHVIYFGLVHGQSYVQSLPHYNLCTCCCYHVKYFFYNHFKLVHVKLSYHSCVQSFGSAPTHTKIGMGLYNSHIAYNMCIIIRWSLNHTASWEDRIWTSSLLYAPVNYVTIYSPIPTFSPFLLHHP